MWPDCQAMEDLMAKFFKEADEKEDARFNRPNKRCKACYKVMYEAGFQAFLLYPATVKLTRGIKDYVFQDMSQAENFMSTLDK